MHKLSPRTRRPRRAPERRRYHAGPAIADEETLAAAVEALRLKDEAFVGRVLAVAGPPPLRRRDPGFAGLVAIIVSQQLSVASASAIFHRLETRFHPLEPWRLTEASDDALRDCGLSTAKIRALRAAAEAAAEGRLRLDILSTLSAEEAHDALNAVKGVGPWTADVFLLFCLGHPDAFPAGDLALQEAARLAFALKSRPDAARLERLAERWRPLRGVAARLLWTYYRAVKGRSGVALGAASR